MFSRIKSKPLSSLIAQPDLWAIDAAMRVSRDRNLVTLMDASGDKLCGTGQGYFIIGAEYVKEGLEAEL